MELEINGKHISLFLAGLTLIIAGMMGVIAFNEGDPTFVGHDASDIEFDGTFNLKEKIQDVELIRKNSLYTYTGSEVASETVQCRTGFCFPTTFPAWLDDPSIPVCALPNTQILAVSTCKSSGISRADCCSSTSVVRLYNSLNSIGKTAE